MSQTEYFFGGVIYIDLRGYSDLVEDKPLKNIAEIIYEYQVNIATKINKLFFSDKIMTIEYMGDGILVIIKDNSNMIDNNSGIRKNSFELKLYDSADVLKQYMVSFISKVQNEYESMMSLDKLDFGMGISCSNIYYHEAGDSRKVFFGTSLNRAAKIGDAVNKDKNNIGIDLQLFEKIENCKSIKTNTTYTRTNLGRVEYVY